MRRIIYMAVVFLALSGCHTNKEESTKKQVKIIESAEKDKIVVTTREYGQLFNYDCHVARKKYSINWCESQYYSYLSDGTKIVLAESFGIPDNDYLVDLNGDGVKELICNCLYMADGVSRVYIYRLAGDGSIEKGTFSLSLTNFEDYEFLGEGARSEQFNSVNNILTIDCHSNEDNYITFKFEGKTIMDGFAWEKFAGKQNK